jgi:hypothetical protein
MRIRLRSKDGRKLEGHISSHGSIMEVKVKDSIKRFSFEKTPFGEIIEETWQHFLLKIWKVSK